MNKAENIPHVSSVSVNTIVFPIIMDTKPSYSSSYDLFYTLSTLKEYFVLFIDQRQIKCESNLIVDLHRSIICINLNTLQNTNNIKWHVRIELPQ